MPFALCPAAMVVLHSALLKLLQAFFDNFQSDYRVQEATEKRQSRDVEENADVFQFNISALYQLQAGWTSRCVQKTCSCRRMGFGRHSLFTASVRSCNGSYESFSISCDLTYGTTKMCETGISQNISTALCYGNKLQCNRM